MNEDLPRSAPGPRDEGPAIVTPGIAAEAAVWVARLHGPDRSARMDRECLDWQQRSAAHRLAFERCTDTWEDVARITLVDAFEASDQFHGVSGPESGPTPTQRTRRIALASAAAACVIAAILIPVWWDRNVYATGVGEERTVVLEDGSRISLNTSSRVRTDFGSARRGVLVEEGEAHIEIAKSGHGPFLVRAGGSEVIAMNTVLCVRLAHGSGAVGDSLSITLLDGVATVRAFAAAPGRGLAPSSPISLDAGERVRFVRPPDSSPAAATMRLDRPRLDEVTAWRRSEAVFDDVSLSEAVAELNRYSRTPIVLVGGASLADLRVSGMYRTGDTPGAARAIAALHGLTMKEAAGRLELSGPH